MGPIEKFAGFVKNGYAGDNAEVARFVEARVESRHLTRVQASELLALLQVDGIGPGATSSRREPAGIGAVPYGHRSEERVRHQESGGNVRRFFAEHQLGAGVLPGAPLAPASQKALADLCRALAPRLVVEIGTNTGSSALAMAEVLPESSRILTTEVDAALSAKARARWQDAGLGKCIESFNLPGLAFLDDITKRLGEGAVDLAFIDANFGDYPAYLAQCLTLVRPGGTIVVDDPLWWGVNEPLMYRWDPETQGLRKLLEIVETRADPRIAGSRLVASGRGLLVIQTQ